MTWTRTRVFLNLFTATVLGACAAEGEEPLALETASDSQQLATPDLTFTVSLRKTGKASVHAAVFDNGNPRCGANATVLALHGLAETGATFGPLAEKLFADPELGRRVARVVALDLVGHGKSGLPEGLPEGAKFGDLTIEDNVDVIIQSIRALRQRGLGPQVIVGHSMGGLEVQAVQERLLSQGSSLAALGIRKAVLFAPVPAHGRPWTTPDASATAQFVVQDPALGSYLSLPPEVWLAQSFFTPAGTVSSGTITPAEVAERGYVGREPLTTLLQLVESPIPSASGELKTLPRPSVRAGAFAPLRGTQLTLFAFEQDTLVPADNLGDLYGHLTGDTSAKGLVRVTSSDATHCMYISNPSALLAPLKSAL